MLRLITCQNATMLLEQHADKPAASSMSASLWLHLRYCPYCNRYAKQTVLIAAWARTAATARAGSDVTLSAGSERADAGAAGGRWIALAPAGQGFRTKFPALLSRRVSPC